MLRDRLVCGVLHEGTQKRLLYEKDLTYQKAVELAQSIELAEKDMKDIKHSTSTTNGKPVLYNQSFQKPAATVPGTDAPKPKGTRVITCYRCGGDHLAPVCKFKDSLCNYCKKKGHLARVCKLKSRQKDRKSQSNDSVHIAETQSPDDNYEGTYSTFTVLQESKDPIRVQVQINEFPVEMELDTGAAVSLISIGTYQSHSEEFHHIPTREDRSKPENLHRTVYPCSWNCHHQSKV